MMGAKSQHGGWKWQLGSPRRNEGVQAVGTARTGVGLQGSITTVSLQEGLRSAPWWLPSPLAATKSDSSQS